MHLTEHVSLAHAYAVIREESLARTVAGVRAVLEDVCPTLAGAL